MRLLERIVWIPIVSACFGTLSIEGKYLAFAWRVCSFKVTMCVRDLKGVPGSLKPICPFRPMPRS